MKPPPKGAQPHRFGDLDPSDYPGERLGLAPTGSGSMARLGRRVLALAVDWMLASFSAWILGFYSGFSVLILFALMQIVAISGFSASLGHLVLGLRLVNIAGGWVGLWRPVVRTGLLILVFPALVWDSDHRGFHDKVAGTALIRR